MRVQCRTKGYNLQAISRPFLALSVIFLLAANGMTSRAFAQTSGKSCLLMSSYDLPPTTECLGIDNRPGFWHTMMKGNMQTRKRFINRLSSQFNLNSMNNNTRHLLETQIVSSAELAELLGVPINTVQMGAYRGQYDFVKKGDALLFDRRDFAKRIEKAQTKKAQNPETSERPAN